MVARQDTDGERGAPCVAIDRLTPAWEPMVARQDTGGERGAALEAGEESGVPVDRELQRDITSEHEWRTVAPERSPTPSSLRSGSSSAH
mmetsp:Transcript_102500/g.287298  ORF Transcript_102500/g.287298 Transcript_102500/m.287298 type:complete len:89 (-) Transcript_102500:253-519(-)